LLDTANKSSDELIPPQEVFNQKTIEIESKSLIVLLSTQYASKIKL